MDGIEVRDMTQRSALVDSGTSTLMVGTGKQLDLFKDLFNSMMQKLVQVCSYNRLYGYLCPCNPKES